MMDKQVLSSLLEEMTPDLINFAQKIVQTKSLTCQEGDVARLVADKMRELDYDEVSVDDVGNVLGRIGSGDPALLFDGHMDTVTVNDTDQWSVEPYGGEIRDGKLYGRGSADTKCPLVAAIFGAALAKRAGLPEGKAIYVSASAMEEDYDGEAVRLLLEKTGLRPRGVVICEPTNLMIATGHRGRALIEIHTVGKSCHGSTPELGINPVYKMRELIGRVEALAEELAAREGEHGSLALTNVYCNTASNNSVPQDATIILDRRLALGESEEIIAAEMDALMAGTDATWCFSDISDKTWTGYPFLFHSFLPAWEIKQEHPLVQAAAKAFADRQGADPVLFKMGCSTNAVTTAGMYHLPSIVLGPGDLAQAHSKDEFCRLDDLVTAVGIHAGICREF